MSNKKDGGYEVGYAAPPQHTRFAKGTSGNPKGRPKGSRNLKTDLEEELNEKVLTRENGKTRKISKRKVIIKMQVKKAAEGDTKAADSIFRLSQSLGLADPPPPERGASVSASEDNALLEDYMRRKAEDEKAKRKSAVATSKNKVKGEKDGK